MDPGIQVVLADQAAMADPPWTQVAMVDQVPRASMADPWTQASMADPGTPWAMAGSPPQNNYWGISSSLGCADARGQWWTKYTDQVLE